MCKALGIPPHKQVGSMLTVMDHSKWALSAALNIYYLSGDTNKDWGQGARDTAQSGMQGSLSLNPQTQVRCPLLVS